MGSGKTTAGRMLADKLQYEFADLDMLIEEHEGLAITQIFALRGEDYFRRVEAEMLKSLFGHEKLVVACGGGTACFHGNMQKMKSAGITVYLKLSPLLLAERLSSEHSERPLVSGMRGNELKNNIRKLLAGREGWYRQADIIYNADAFDIQELLSLVRSVTNHEG